MKMGARVGVIASVFVWIFASIWSGYCVAYGLITAQNFKSFPEWSIYAFAFVLQMTVSLAVLYLPRILTASWKRNALPVFFCFLIVFVIQTGELFHQIIAQVKNSQGTGLVQSNISKINSIDGSITSLSNEISAAVKGIKESYEAQKLNAKRGDDVTGLTGCGRICTSAIRRRDIVERYVGYFSSEIQGISSESSSAREHIDHVRARLSALENRVSRLSELESEVNQDVRQFGGNELRVLGSAQTSLASIHAAVETYESGISNSGIASEVDLSMDAAFSILKNLWELNFSAINPRSWLSIFYGLASFGCIIVSSTIISKLNTYDVIEKEIHEETTHHNKMADLFEKLRIARGARYVREKLNRGYHSVLDSIFKRPA
jgi:hypothetical protein